ncbi:hypothetical protein ABPG77_007827 [Micractinium sp. CCAP 211/92]
MPSWALLFGARPLQCQDNVVTLGNLKSFSFDQLVKFNLQKCSSDSDCCDKHCVGVGPAKGCLPCVPPKLGSCQTSDDCCFSDQCQNKSCCRSNGSPCTPGINVTLPFAPGLFCCSGICDLTEFTCQSCVPHDNKCASDSDCCQLFGDKQECGNAGKCCYSKGVSCQTGSPGCCNGACNAGICP